MSWTGAPGGHPFHPPPPPSAAPVPPPVRPARARRPRSPIPYEHRPVGHYGYDRFGNPLDNHGVTRTDDWIRGEEAKVPDHVAHGLDAQFLIDMDVRRSAQTADHGMSQAALQHAMRRSEDGLHLHRLRMPEVPAVLNELRERASIVPGLQRRAQRHQVPEHPTADHKVNLPDEGELQWSAPIGAPNEGGLAEAGPAAAPARPAADPSYGPHRHARRHRRE